MIRVVVVDDQAVVRDGLKVILEAAPDITVVGEAADGLQAIEVAGSTDPDVVLMDVRMPRLDGIEATRRLVAAGGETPRVLMLTTFGEEGYIYGALKAGAGGFLLKDADRGEIVAGIRAVASGDQLLAPTVTRRLIEAYVRRRPPGSPTTPDLAELTQREVDVARLVAKGLSNGEIAQQLVISPGTVKTHVGHVLAKCGVRDRIQLVVLAYETGLVEPGD